MGSGKTCLRMRDAGGSMRWVGKTHPPPAIRHASRVMMPSTDAIFPLVDTHAHLDDARLKSDWDGVLERARQAGVVQVVAIGTTAADSAAVRDLARTHRGLYAAVGIHPNDAAEAGEADWSLVVELAGQPGVVAVGETVSTATGTERRSRSSRSGSAAIWSWRTGSTYPW